MVWYDKLTNERSDASANEHTNAATKLSANSGAHSSPDARTDCDDSADALGLLHRFFLIKFARRGV